MTDVKSLVQTAQTSKLDGAQDISKAEYQQIKKTYRDDPQSRESIKWLEKERPQLYAALVSGLDYTGYVGTSNGSLNTTRAGEELEEDAGRRAAKLNRLPPLRTYGANGLPKSVGGGDVQPVDVASGAKVMGYQTGPNYTMVKGDGLEKITDAQAEASRDKQRDFCDKMSGVMGVDVQNPPSATAARGYLQTLADRGASTEQIKQEYDQFLKTFYAHPGGVSWKDGLDPKNIDQRFGEQPIAKDGRRLIDCEGFAALSENVLGGLKKNGQPMFDVKLSSSAEHVVCGVFPHGQDPKSGFVVDNYNVRDLALDPAQAKDYDKTKDRDARMRFLLREHMRTNNEGQATQYGDTYADMKPPPSKVLR